MLATPDGIYNLDFNGNVTLLKSGETIALEAVPMNPLYYNMFFQNMTALAFNADGTWNPDIAGKAVNYSGTPVGMAANDYALYVADSNSVSIIRDMPFLEKMKVPAYRPHTLVSDINRDGIVDPNDLAYLAGVWLTANTAADFDADGGVILPDFAAMSGEWLKTEAWYEPAAN